MFTANSLSDNAMPEAGVLPGGLVYMVQEVGPGKCRWHEDYWVPVAPGMQKSLRKIVKRKLRKPEIPEATALGQDQDMLDRELQTIDARHIFKVTRDAIRKNHYKHMHYQEDPPTSKSKPESRLGTKLDETNGRQTSATRKAEAQSEFRLRQNEKAKAAARDILSTEKKQQITQSALSKHYTGESQVDIAKAGNEMRRF